MTKFLCFLLFAIFPVTVVAQSQVRKDADSDTIMALFVKLNASEQKEVLAALHRLHESDQEKTWHGTIARIIDGDTVVLVDKTHGRNIVRLNEIDAPESNQPFGNEATEYLKEQIDGKTVTVKWKERDRYGRIIGDIKVNETNVNAEMIREGYAWFYIEYGVTLELANLEKEAREKKKGLWATNDPLAPWYFRSKPVAQPDNVASNSAQQYYITKSGKKYHNAHCSALKHSAIPIFLDEAKRRGYEPCGICKP